VHVILLGDDDTYNGKEDGGKKAQANLDLLARSLDHLSALSLEGSRLNFTHEKTVYHTVTAPALSDAVSKALAQEVRHVHHQALTPTLP